MCILLTLCGAAAGTQLGPGLATSPSSVHHIAHVHNSTLLHEARLSTAVGACVRQQGFPRVPHSCNLTACPLAVRIGVMQPCRLGDTVVNVHQSCVPSCCACFLESWLPYCSTARPVPTSTRCPHGITCITSSLVHRLLRKLWRLWRLCPIRGRQSAHCLLSSRVTGRWTHTRSINFDLSLSLRVSLQHLVKSRWQLLPVQVSLCPHLTVCWRRHARASRPAVGLMKCPSLSTATR